MNWVCVGEKNINLDAVARFEIRNEGSGRIVLLYFGKDDSLYFHGAFAEALIEVLVPATKLIGPPGPQPARPLTVR